MNTAPFRLAALCLLGATLTLPVHAGIAEADDETNARIARAKVQRGNVRAISVKPVDASQPAGRGGDLLGDGCSIAIGNVFDAGRPGIGTSARAQTTVVVQGDVIMANNRCN